MLKLIKVTNMLLSFLQTAEETNKKGIQNTPPNLISEAKTKAKIKTKHCFRNKTLHDYIVHIV